LTEKLAAQEKFHGSQKQEEIPVPHWNADVRTLTWQDLLVKRFRTSALCQEIVLTAFERDKWQKRISNPLPRDSGVEPSHQLRDTIRRLNNHQLQAKILFSRD